MNVSYFTALSPAPVTCSVTCETPTDWQQIADWLDENGGTVTVCKNCVSHPESAGMRRGTGLPAGQSSDWRFKLDDCRDLHTQDFGSTWRVHLDQWDPACGVFRHMLMDMPVISVLTSALSSGLIGMAFGSPLVGAGLGALEGIGAVALARLTRPARRPPCLKEGRCTP